MENYTSKIEKLSNVICFVLINGSISIKKLSKSEILILLHRFFQARSNLAIAHPFEIYYLTSLSLFSRSFNRIWICYIFIKKYLEKALEQILLKEDMYWIAFLNRYWLHGEEKFLWYAYYFLSELLQKLFTIREVYHVYLSGPPRVLVKLCTISSLFNLS